LPPVGAEVVTTTGRGRVLAQEILAGQVLVETEDMRRIVINAADVLTVLTRGKKRSPDVGPADDELIAEADTVVVATELLVEVDSPSDLSGEDSTDDDQSLDDEIDPTL
jgi:hypothetical protein